MPEIIGMKTAQAAGYLFLKTITLLFTLTMTLFYSHQNLHLLEFSIIHSQKAVLVNS